MSGVDDLIGESDAVFDEKIARLARTSEEISLKDIAGSLIETQKFLSAQAIIVSTMLDLADAKIDEVLREVRQERARTLFGDPEKP